jgi:shikimate kinase
MGAGKSRLGRRLSQVLGLPFVDSDDEVERAAGMRISEIFETLGEPAFRDGEARVIRRLLGHGAQVISTGGGAVMRPETADLIWAQSLSIWVRADLGILAARTRNGRPRPLLAGKDPESVLRELSVTRDPVYARAMMQVDTGSGDDDAIMMQALRGLQDLLGDCDE